MSKHPFKMWVNVADFLAKTQHLSPAELGSYVRLHFTMWLATDGTLPNTPRILMRIAKVRACHWAGMWKAIKDLFTARGKTITNEALQADLFEAKTKIELAAISGRKGGQASQFRRSMEPKLRGRWQGHKPLKNNDGGQANAQANTIQQYKTKEERESLPLPCDGKASASLEKKEEATREESVVVPYPSLPTPTPPECPISDEEKAERMARLGDLKRKLREGSAR
jgi:uncharacterized protein YdaU (DUF1376 family)